MECVFLPYRFRIFKNSGISVKITWSFLTASMYLSIHSPDKRRHSHQSECTEYFWLIWPLSVCVFIELMENNNLLSLYIAWHLEQMEICIWFLLNLQIFLPVLPYVSILELVCIKTFPVISLLNVIVLFSTQCMSGLIFNLPLILCSQMFVW